MKGKKYSCSKSFPRSPFLSPFLPSFFRPSSNITGIDRTLYCDAQHKRPPRVKVYSSLVVYQTLSRVHISVNSIANKATLMRTHLDVGGRSRRVRAFLAIQYTHTTSQAPLFPMLLEGGTEYGNTLFAGRVTNGAWCSLKETLTIESCSLDWPRTAPFFNAILSKKVDCSNRVDDLNWRCGVLCSDRIWFDISPPKKFESLS